MHGDEFATWAVLGDDPLDLAAGLQDGGHAVTDHPDLDGLLAVLDAGVPAPEWVLLPAAPRDPAAPTPTPAIRAAEDQAGALLDRWLADERLTDIRLAVVTRGGVPAQLTATAAPDPAGVTATDGVGVPVSDSVGTAVHHLVRRTQAEHPGRVVHLDLDAAPDPDLPHALRTAHATAEPTLALRDGTLLVPRARRLPLNTPEEYAPLAGTVLLTAAGDGAPAAALAHHLVTERSVRTLLVAAPATDPLTELATALDGALGDLLTTHGATLERATGDPTDRGWLTALLDALPAEQPLTAVVDTAADPTTTLHLHELTKEHPLEAFAVLAAAPDARLTALAHHRHTAGLPVALVTSAPWDRRTKAPAAPGPDPAPQAAPPSAARVLAAALHLSLPPLVTTRLDPTDLRRHAAAGTLPPELRDLVPAGPTRRRGAAGATHGTDPDAGDALLARLAGLTADERLRHLTDLVRREAAAVLGHDSVDAVDAERQFKEVGFDSMMSVQLRNRLGAETGFSFPATLVFTYPAPATLAAHLDERLRLAGGGPATTDPTDRVLAEIERLDTALAAVESDLTDDEARARVVKRLQSVLWRWTGNTAPTGDSPGEGVLDDIALDAVTDDEMFDLIDRELGA
ncbi:phosphopantetheine-binding protein [Streptomyces sp. NPDC057806]|uniref:phosphopantetheine-binding protein n=1 Tax=Streptomyces sp. NPDC057806 TaxID=3346255 RepID=UPI003677912D